MRTLKSNQIIALLGAMMFLIVTYLISLHNYLLFHGLVESLSICISFTVFVIAWNSRKYLNDNYLLIIGIAYLFIGLLDLLHTMAYNGMGIFTAYNFYANQLWIAARYFESIVILVALFFAGRKKTVNINGLIVIDTIITGLIIFSIFFSELFPVCFIEGQGQTIFKLVSEYIIISILGLSLLLVYKKKALFEKKLALLLIGSIVMTMLSELAFTFYISNYDFSNLMGHYFKIISFYFIYQAIVVTGIRNPYDLIFKELLAANEEMLTLNKQLVISVEKSEQANQLKSKYLSVISHEMRTPLNGILGFTQMLKRTNPTEEQQDYIDEVLSSANVLRNSIDNILDIEKIRNDKMQYFENENMLEQLFLERLIFYQSLCRDKGVTFESEIKISPTLKVMIDSEKFQQLLNNFISNAVKFTEEGKISLRAACQEETEAIKLLIQVEDTGTGILEEDQKNLFEPFVQVNGTKKTKYGGSGLGLSICKEIVSHYHGEIKVESKLNVGTQFTIQLLLERIS